MTTARVNGESNEMNTFCTSIQEKWVDIALIIGCIACLAIGVLATEGYLNAIGTVNTTHLAYGMYGAAGLALIIEVAKIAAGSCKQKLDPRSDAPSVAHPNIETIQLSTAPRAFNPSSSFPPEIQKHLDAVHAFLASRSFVKKLEYYTFYYQLASISEYILNTNLSKEGWKTFLNEIHGVELKGASHIHQIDCSFELRRIEGEKILLHFNQIHNHNHNHNHKDLEQASKIGNEAFENYSARRQYSIKEREECYVIRADSSSGEILGYIFILEYMGAIYIHDLARKASAVKLGITEHFNIHLKPILELKKKSGCPVFCNVDLDNKVAIKIYLDLGFRFAKMSSTSGKMEYLPELPRNSNNLDC